MQRFRIRVVIYGCPDIGRKRAADRIGSVRFHFAVCRQVHIHARSLAERMAGYGGIFVCRRGKGRT